MTVTLKYDKQNSSRINGLYFFGALVAAIGIPIRSYIDGYLLVGILISVALLSLYYAFYRHSLKSAESYLTIDKKQIAYYTPNFFNKLRCKWSINLDDYVKVILKASKIQATYNVNLKGVVFELFSRNYHEDVIKKEALVEITDEDALKLTQLISESNLNLWFEK